MPHPSVPQQSVISPALFFVRVVLHTALGNALIALMTIEKVLLDAPSPNEHSQIPILRHDREIMEPEDPRAW